LRSNIISYEDIPKRVLENIGDTHSRRISRLVIDTINSTINNDYKFISISSEILDEINFLRYFLFENVYESKKNKNRI